ncbi:hypothetical protein K4L44_07965 [Halosquirtibacter laminarini]|uniref:Uncharacterized protein n=1 Tax=Halosquirtibacter laminarini TaxID=3374600 RepID=A0AC61NJ60_9BACT|nr:hypothetical protein K4L44_07965 [Prolixibacteraceae bacterium]
MIKLDQAITILENGFKKLENSQGPLQLEDIEPEVINQACRYILNNYPVKSTHNIQNIGSVRPQNVHLLPITQTFVQAAHILYPEKYDLKEMMNYAPISIINNISWAGMGEFLEDYFAKKHFEKKCKSNSQSEIFYSTKHQRWEDGLLITESQVNRNVNLRFSENREELLVSVEPTLSAKRAFLVSSQDKTFCYQGEDPDFYFRMELNHFDEIQLFELFRVDRNLKIIYFE